MTLSTKALTADEIVIPMSLQMSSNFFIFILFNSLKHAIIINAHGNTPFYAICFTCNACLTLLSHNSNLKSRDVDKIVINT